MKEDNFLNCFLFNKNMVVRTGFEPVNACVKGMCVKPTSPTDHNNENKLFKLPQPRT